MPEKTASTSWTCTRCEMTVSWMPGSETPELPPNWTVADDEAYCLGCRRDRAGEEGIEQMDGTPTLDDQRRQRVLSRIAFEIDRSPETPDNRIAKACHTSVIAVRKARKELGLTARPPEPQADR
jgi:hypothetical protein